MVDNEGFKRLVNVLEPRYKIPSRTDFSKMLPPTLYQETKTKVKESIEKAESVSLTTDS